jgi:hypothetical protein
VRVVSEVEAVVAATSIESGRFHAVERVINLDSLLHLFEQLTGLGHGYLEVRSTENEFPLVTVGLQGGFVVIHCAFTPDRTALLYGDGSVAPRETVDVPIMDELAIFTGEFVLNPHGHGRCSRTSFAPATRRVLASGATCD